MNHLLHLSENGIEELQKLEETGTKKTVTVDVILQVHNLKINDPKKPKGPFTLTLADMKEKYGGFLFLNNPNNPEIKIGDIINIKVVSVAHLSKDNRKIFIIKSHEIKATSQPLLSNLEDYNKSQNDTSNIKSNNISYNQNPLANKENQLKKNGSEFIPELQGCDLLSHITSFTTKVHIYVKVTKKMEIRHFTNRQNHQPGQLFSFNICDVEGNEMQTTTFGDACENFYKIIQEGGVYEITGAQVKINDKKFASVKSEYKLILDDKTSIVEREDNGNFKKTKFIFVKISDITNMQIGNLIDVIAVVIEVNDRTTINTKNGEQNLRRLKIGDASGYKIEITLWRAFSDIPISENQIIAMKNIRIGEFNGRILSTVDSSEIIIDPKELPEFQSLKEFLAKGNLWQPLPNSGKLSDSSPQVELSYLKEIMDSCDEISDDRFGVTRFKATVCIINHGTRNFYAGCPEKTCKKKLVEDNNGWYCKGCDKRCEKPLYYYTLSFKVKDASGEQWVDMFGDIVEKFLGVECEEYKDFVNKDDTAALNEVSQRVLFKSFIFVGRAKNQVYNGISKRRLSVYRYQEIDYILEGKKMINLFKSLFK